MDARYSPLTQAPPMPCAGRQVTGDIVTADHPAPGVDIRRRLMVWILTPSPRAFLVGLCGMFGVGVLSMFVFSWYVNPWGDFGKTGFHRLYNARLAKADFIDRLPKGELPKIVVMGSSNTMQYSPATIEKLMGKSAFNFGVFWGRTEDFLCITRHFVHDLDHRPTLLILGLDTWSFVPAMNEHPVFPGIRRRLLNARQLSKHLPGVNVVNLSWANFIDSLSRQQLALSWKLLWDDRYTRKVAPPLESSEWFESDGTRIRYLSEGDNIFSSVEAGTYPISQVIRRAINKADGDGIGVRFVDRFAMYDFSEVDQTKIEYMAALLDLCQREQIKVVFAINPVQPLLYRELTAHTRHQENLERLRTMLDRYKSDYSVVSGVVDASDLESLGGDPEGFFDPMHPATRNCDLIIERIAALVDLK